MWIAAQHMHSAGRRGRSPQGSIPWLCPQAKRLGYTPKIRKWPAKEGPKMQQGESPYAETALVIYGPLARRSSWPLIRAWDRFDSYMVRHSPRHNGLGASCWRAACNAGRERYQRRRAYHRAVTAGRIRARARRWIRWLSIGPYIQPLWG